MQRKFTFSNSFREMLRQNMLFPRFKLPGNKLGSCNLKNVAPYRVSDPHGRAKKSDDIADFWLHASNTQENILFLIEVKALSVFEQEAQEGRKQLKSYVAAAMNCRFAAFTWKRWFSFDVVTRDDGWRSLLKHAAFSRLSKRS